MNFKAYYNQNQRWKTQTLKRCSFLADQKVNTWKIDKRVSKGSVWFKSMGITWMTSSARSLHLWAFGWRWSPSGIPHGLSLLGTGLVSLISLPLSDPPKESQRGNRQHFFLGLPNLSPRRHRFWIYTFFLALCKLFYRAELYALLIGGTTISLKNK